MVFYTTLIKSVPAVSTNNPLIRSNRCHKCCKKKKKKKKKNASLAKPEPVEGKKAKTVDWLAASFEPGGVRGGKTVWRSPPKMGRGSPPGEGKNRGSEALTIEISTEDSKAPATPWRPSRSRPGRRCHAPSGLNPFDGCSPPRNWNRNPGTGTTLAETQKKKKRDATSTLAISFTKVDSDTSAGVASISTQTLRSRSYHFKY